MALAQEQEEGDRRINADRHSVARRIVFVLTIDGTVVLHVVDRDSQTVPNIFSGISKSSSDMTGFHI